MSHRVKNLLQIATALTQITSRSTTTKEEMASDLTSRLMALGRAQDLVRPVPDACIKRRFWATSSRQCSRRTTKS
jgi:two-component sensor histidine kinase